LHRSAAFIYERSFARAKSGGICSDHHERRYLTRASSGLLNIQSLGLPLESLVARKGKKVLGRNRRTRSRRCFGRLLKMKRIGRRSLRR
jgi:hypothetical protein